MSANVKYSKPFSHKIGDNSYQVSVTNIMIAGKRFAITKNMKTKLYMLAEYRSSSWVGSDREGWSVSSVPTVIHFGTSQKTSQDAIQTLLLLAETHKDRALLDGRKIRSFV